MVLRNRSIPDLIGTPRLDVDVLGLHRTESTDEGGGQTAVGDKRDVEVDGRTADLVAVGELVDGEILRNVDHHVDLLLVEHVEGLRLLVGIRRPID